MSAKIVVYIPQWSVQASMTIIYDNSKWED